MNNKNKVNNSATIAFTLPISCQICLGKVKQPVVCSNQHVFCGPCMDVWLQRNQQCPTCRVPVSNENPVRHVLGGLSSQVDDADKFSNRELRRARMELIYKDYEELISQLENELQTSKQENKEMELRLQAHAYSDSRSKPSSPPDKTLIISLNNKIKDATTLYDQVKGEMKGLKEENTVLRNKNEDLSRENRTLRLELVNRSPRRYFSLFISFHNIHYYVILQAWPLHSHRS
ncbi:hypothetical protein CAPTEDRAFT_141660 [Capitella teleta]|uniref:RING-type domain-containing protein n=1 Tax=Capitella teleta TaxID=283909 RepID=R7VEZ8_CAPTE|nr:hypothetical protein CAPTEDRAFT_141660 [Capitella teleta]|eukprot:ELU17433.1 hypothetical protein CAPTEDRAFT_141660 [Capitella teleta]